MLILGKLHLLSRNGSIQHARQISVNELHATIIFTIIVCVKMVWNSEENEIKLLKHGKTVIAVKQAHIPVVILPSDLTRDRKQYLYEHARPFVTPQYQDIACPNHNH